MSSSFPSTPAEPACDLPTGHPPRRSVTCGPLPFRPAVWLVRFLFCSTGSRKPQPVNASSARAVPCGVDHISIADPGHDLREKKILPWQTGGPASVIDTPPTRHPPGPRRLPSCRDRPLTPFLALDLIDSTLLPPQIRFGSDLSRHQPSPDSDAHPIPAQEPNGRLPPSPAPFPFPDEFSLYLTFCLAPSKQMVSTVSLSIC